MDVMTFIIRTVEVFLVIYLIASFFRVLSYKVPFVTALICLVAAATLTALYSQQLFDLAKRLADLTYYGMIVGFMVMLKNFFRTIRDEE